MTRDLSDIAQVFFPFWFYISNSLRVFIIPFLMDVSSQMVEDDLVEARQADRSLGSKDFSRLETEF